MNDVTATKVRKPRDEKLSTVTVSYTAKDNAKAATSAQRKVVVAMRKYPDASATNDGLTNLSFNIRAKRAETLATAVRAIEGLENLKVEIAA